MYAARYGHTLLNSEGVVQARTTPLPTKWRYGEPNGSVRCSNARRAVSCTLRRAVQIDPVDMVEGTVELLAVCGPAGVTIHHAGEGLGRARGAADCAALVDPFPVPVLDQRVGAAPTACGRRS